MWAKASQTLVVQFQSVTHIQGSLCTVLNCGQQSVLKFSLFLFSLWLFGTFHIFAGYIKASKVSFSAESLSQYEIKSVFCFYSELPRFSNFNAEIVSIKISGSDRMPQVIVQLFFFSAALFICCCPVQLNKSFQEIQV